MPQPPLTFVLSLRERTDRRDVFSLPWDFEYLIQERVVNPNNDDYSNADRGCAAAHREAVLRAKEAGAPYVLVLEDDALYLGDGPLTPLGDITMLGGMHNPITKVYAVNKNNALCYFTAGTHAVIYTEKVYDDLIRNLPSKESLNTQPELTANAFDLWITSRGVHYHPTPTFKLIADSPAAKSSIATAKMVDPGGNKKLNASCDYLYSLIKKALR